MINFDNQANTRKDNSKDMDPKQENDNPQELKNQIYGLSTLLQLSNEARKSEDLPALGFIAVNETQNLVRYDQSFFWKQGKISKGFILAASGVSTLDKNTHMIVWMRIAGSFLARNNYKTPTIINPDIFPEKLQKTINENLSGHLLWAPLIDMDGVCAGGLILVRKKLWTDNESKLMARICELYAYTLRALEKRDPLYKHILSFFFKKKVLWFVVCLLPFIMMIKVPISTLAPAQIVARDPLILSAPYNGVFKKFSVEQNTNVNAGDLLFELDDTDLSNRHLIMQKSLAVAKADYFRASKEAFFNPKAKVELNLLKAKMEEKNAELKYTNELLSRIKVKADKSGVAIFGNPNDWVGKPLTLGEKVMMIADPAKAEILAFVSVDDAVTLEKNSRVTLFLNVAPLTPLEAFIRHSSFEAEPTPEGIMSYYVRCSFDENVKLPRIGLKGTAKIYGKNVSLFYYLFRRPVSTLRRFLGL